MELLHVQQRLGDLAGAALSRKRQRFSTLTASLDAMSPLKVLGRGYAMAQNESGEVLRSAQQVEVGEQVHVRLGQGSLRCTVNEKGE